MRNDKDKKSWFKSFFFFLNRIINFVQVFLAFSDGTNTSAIIDRLNQLAEKLYFCLVSA